MDRIIILAGILLLLSGVALAETCLEGNCQDGSGTIQWDDGSKFSGNFVNGAPDGDGIYTDPNGKEFTVTYKDGQPSPRRRQKVHRPSL